MRTSPVLLFAVLVILIFSCNADKRLYRNGYYRHGSADSRGYKQKVSSSQDAGLQSIAFSEESSTDDTIVRVIQSTDTVQLYSDSVSLPVTPKDTVRSSSSGQQVTKDPIFPKPQRIEEVYDARNAAFISVIMLILSMAMMISGVGLEAVALFAAGFVLVGLAQGMAIYALIKLYQLVKKFPQLRATRSSSDGEMKSPYIHNKVDHDADLEKFRTARVRTLIYAWTVLVGFFVGSMIIMGMFFGQ